jgi:hypothetical protein
MDEGDTNGPDAPPPLGGLTAEDGLIPSSADELLGRNDLAVFVGPNAGKFVSVSGSAGGRSRVACWPGFFFPVAWFMYRKMYGWAALACVLPIFAGVMNFGPFKPVVIGLPTVAGLLGRRVYVAGARRTIVRIRAPLSDRAEDELREALERAGGVSVPGAIVGGAIVFCAFVVAFIAGFKARHL